MALSASNESLPPDIREKILVQCSRFEEVCKSGKSPQIDDYLEEFAGDARAQLILELTALEEQYLPKIHGKSTLNSIPLETDDAMMTIAENSRQPMSHIASADVTHANVSGESVPSTTGQEPTVAHTATRQGSVGLQIRCPHCANGVELLADTPFEDISCTDCGSTFNLVDREKLTTAASTRKSIGRFELVERLGTGGFGTVWKARDTELDRIVAVKIPRKGQLEEADIEQFYREARAAAQLSHPNIVAVHEVGRDGNTVFIVSDMIRGVSLSEWMLNQRCNSHDVALLCVKVADALQHAHEQGIIHRDMKPSNVMIDLAGEPHLMDFGLAKREVGEVTMTVEGQILGTPSYMSPEQAGGQSHWVDRRSDIYSLGVMIFKMLTNELPFRGAIRVQIQQRLSEDAPDPRTLNRFIPRDMSTICLKCLERDPNSRYPSAQALADELRRFLRGEPIRARPISRLARAGRWAKRQPAVASAGALALFLMVAGPVTAFSINNQRNRLADLVVEKDNVITRMGENSEESTKNSQKLEEKIKLLKGEANPWEIWGEEPGKNNRLLTLKRLFDGQYPAMTASLTAGATSGNYDDRQLACGHLAMAMISDKAQQNEAAEKHYQTARGLLEGLARQLPGEVSTLRALANCQTQLSRLYANNRRDEAKKLLQQALFIYQRLAEEHSENKEHYVDWMESELQHAVMGIGEATDHTLRGRDLERRLRSKWPSDPVEMYKIASYLTRQQPVLLDIASPDEKQ